MRRARATSNLHRCCDRMCAGGKDDISSEFACNARPVLDPTDYCRYGESGLLDRRLTGHRALKRQQYFLNIPQPLPELYLPCAVAPFDAVAQCNLCESLH